MTYLAAVLCAAGLYLLLSARWPGIYRPAALAIRRRAPKPLSQTDVVIARMASVLQPYMDIDPIKRTRLEETLRSLRRDETPEHFQATALSRGLLFSPCALPLMIFSLPFALAIMVVLIASIYRSEIQKLEKEMDDRRQSIERELPQFASTIRQSLNSTHDVVSILNSYKQVCGPALRGEIERTLNDMITGSSERAIKALESRVASPKLGQLTRGLIAVLRGDDQRLYFDMLATEYRKSQNEEVEKELLQRPGQLNLWMGLLFLALCLLIAAGLGQFLMQQITNF